MPRVVVLLGICAAAAAAVPAGAQAFSVTEGAPFSGVAATATATVPFACGPIAIGTQVTGTIQWGDGATGPGTLTVASCSNLSSVSSTLSFNVTGSHAYAEANTYGVNAQFLVDGIFSFAASGTASVSDAPLTPGTAGATATEGVFSGTVGTFTDPNPLSTPADFRATIDWGDGSSSNGTVIGGNGSFSVLGSHSFDEGAFPVKVFVADNEGATTSMSGQLEVKDATLSGTPIGFETFAGVPFTGPVAALRDGNPLASASDLTATIDWGDGTTTTGSVTPGANGVFQVSGSHTFAAPATYAMKIRVSDDGSSTTTIQSSVQIGSPPVPTTTISPLPATPTGNHGWYRGPVHIIVTANGLGVPVAATRCVLDPPSPPSTFDALPPSCPFAGPGADVSGDGTHVLYAASANAAGEKEVPTSTTIGVDVTPPQVKCAATPTFVIGSHGGVITATVTDATSGPVSSTVSATPDLSSAGRKTVALTGEDNAGNTSTKRCPYRVLDHVNNLLTWHFLPSGTYTVAAELTAYDVPSGARIKVSCSRAGCPFRTRTVPVGSSTLCKSSHCHRSSRPHTKTVDLTDRFRGRHLAVRTQIVISVTRQYAIGKVWIFTIRSNQVPTSRVTCLAPGSSTPGRGC